MAGQSKDIVTRSATSGTNLGANVGYIVEEQASGEVILATAAAGTLNLGVIWSAENVAAGAVGVCIGGRCKVVAGEAFTPGTHSMYFVAGASGSAVRPEIATINLVIGKILSTVAVASNDIVDALISPHATLTLVA
jgi:hypothetical protein